MVESGSGTTLASVVVTIVRVRGVGAAPSSIAMKEPGVMGDGGI